MDYQAKPQSEVAPFIAARIIAALKQHRRVLWLLSGGSGGEVCVAASKLLQEHDLSRLYVTMSDERYGEVGHADENFKQLLDQGLSLGNATFYRPLFGDSLEKTVSSFSGWLDQTLAQVDYTIAVLGIGEDGHTSGIKPHSDALSSSSAATGFTGEDFTRVTTTTTYLRKINEAIVQAYGPRKHPLVQRLLQGEGSSTDYPMLVIRDIPRVTVFSDYQLQGK